MAYATIDNPELFFQTKLYSGTGSALSITLDGSENMQPDWVWIKERNASASSHNLTDSVRGAGKGLFSNDTSQEYDYGTGSSGSVRSFDSDGFTMGATGDIIGTNTHTYVAWQWKANGGTTTTNDASATSVGDQDSVYQANTTAGFSIVTYTGTGSGNTIGHGLGATPDWIIVKVRSTTNNWGVWHKDLGGANKYLKLNTSDSTITATDVWNNTLPTSTVFSTGAAGTTNDSGETYVAFCFTSIKGYSKFGSYVGDGSADGTFVYTGFKPAWLMVKCTSNSGDYWFICDNKRDVDNPVVAGIRADTDNNENSGLMAFDFLSNGFKAVDSGGQNLSGRDYIYMAFAEHPFVSSGGVPVTARGSTA